VQGNARKNGFTNGLINGYRNGLTNGLSNQALRRTGGKEGKYGKILPIAVLCFLVLGVFAVLTYQNQQKNTITPDTFFVESIARNVQSVGMEIKGTAHNPIYINGNADFASQASANGWPGNGTQGNPYIIDSYDIDGQGGTYCIWIENTNVWFVIRNCNLWNATSDASQPWGTGLCLKNVTHGTVTNNYCSHDRYGICLWWYSSSNTITNNNCSHNSEDGICLWWYSSSNNIANNNCSENSENGIYLYYSPYNNITSNTLWNNGIGIGGESLEYWNTHIIENNRVNGKPVYYYKNQNGCTVPSNAGEVILANCTNMVVSGLTLTNTSIGIELGFSSYNTITNNNCSGNSRDGIRLISSSNNNITNNNCSDNSRYGIFLYYFSSNNTITNNNCSSSSQAGIYLYSSSNNTIATNTCSGNSYGIFLYWAQATTTSRTTTARAMGLAYICIPQPTTPSHPITSTITRTMQYTSHLVPQATQYITTTSITTTVQARASVATARHTMMLAVTTGTIIQHRKATTGATGTGRDGAQQVHIPLLAEQHLTGIRLAVLCQSFPRLQCLSCVSPQLSSGICRDCRGENQ
jgi:parallel beta-helix repeat protein